MNPSLRQAVIDRARSRDPVAAATEFDAQFRPDVSQALEESWIEAAIETNVLQRPASNSPGSPHLFQYVGFLDAAGGSGRDSFSAAVAHAEGDLLLLDAVLEVRPPFSTEVAVERCASMFQTYGVTTCLADKYAGDWPRQALARHGINLQHSDKSKSEIYLEAVSLFSSGKIRLLDQDRLLLQLRHLERRAGRGGRDTIDHPRGGTDDLANSACGALLRASECRSTGFEVFFVRSEISAALEAELASWSQGPAPGGARPNATRRRWEIHGGRCRRSRSSARRSAATNKATVARICGLSAGTRSRPPRFNRLS